MLQTGYSVIHCSRPDDARLGMRVIQTPQLPLELVALAQFSACVVLSQAATA